MKTYKATVRLSPDDLKEIIRAHFALSETAHITFNHGVIYDGPGGSQSGFTGADVEMTVPPSGERAELDWRSNDGSVIRAPIA